MVWHIRYFFLKKPLPLACGLYITSRCNLKCEFCNIWRKKTAVTLPLPEAKNIVDNLSDAGCFYLSISGGEPLLFDGLFELLRYAKKTKIRYVHMVTNGFILDKNMALQLNQTGINELSISIDGTESFHDAKRGVRGAYTKALTAIENLKIHATRINIVLNAIFSPEAPTECLHVIELAHKFSIYVKVQPLNQHPPFNGTNSAVISHQNIFPSQIKEVITELCREPRVVNSTAFLKNIYNFFCDKEQLIFKKSPCLFGYHHIEILEDGSIFPCLEGLHWKSGFSLSGRLKDLINSAEYGRVLEKLKKCKGCQGNYYICYYEPRIVFPIHNFVRFAILPR
jgi:MoaA/NifB/PqqE/SkfB family radical SAM enzyme